MPELKSQVTPLLPLTTGVVLPGMVVTIALETDEARSAIAAARSADETVLLVPRVDRDATQGRRWSLRSFDLPPSC